jgi:hypothetical protein
MQMHTRRLTGEDPITVKHHCDCASIGVAPWADAHTQNVQYLVDSFERELRAGNRDAAINREALARSNRSFDSILLCISSGAR